MTVQDKVQKEIVEKTLKFFEKDRFGYIDGAMRLGKIKITIDVLKKGFKSEENILLCYPNNTIVDSWNKEFEKWGYNNPNIIFCNFSSLWKYENEVFGLLILDEFHEASFNQKEVCHIMMTNSLKTKCLALSGTISKETKEGWGLKEIAKYTTDEGIESGILADYKITIHTIELDDKIKTSNRKGKLLTEKQRYSALSWVINEKKRSKEDSLHLALARNRLSVKSIGKMNYLKSLLSKMKDKRVIIFCGFSEVADKVGVPSFHSKSKDDQNFKDFQEKKINHLALAEIGRIGVTFTELDSVIMLNTVYNQATMSQSINRAIKLDYPNKVADIHCIILNEEPEIKKIKEGLGMLNLSKIIWKY